MIRPKTKSWLGYNDAKLKSRSANYDENNTFIFEIEECVSLMQRLHTEVFHCINYNSK